MSQRQLAEWLQALRDLLTWLETNTPINLLDFPVFEVSDSLRTEIEDLNWEQKQCDETPVDEDNPWADTDWESMLQVRRYDLAKRLTEEVSLTLLVGRLMAHVRRRRTGRLIAALQSGVRAILDAAPPAGPSREEA
jgi:hypothetical protein